MKTLIIVYSYHHHNTEKIANAMAKVLDASVKMPQQIDPTELDGYDCIGFGSGIDSGKHYRPLLDLVESLPVVEKKKAFIFSTSAISNDAKVAEDHRCLRDKLRTKGYSIVDEFGCLGFNTNSFLRWFGGMNKGRPNAEDLHHAEEFARHLNGEEVQKKS